MQSFKKIRVLPFLLLFFLSCRKPTTANWDVDVVLPVVNSTLNIKNFIGDSIFTTDNTGLLSLSINRQIAALKLDSLLSLPDTTIAPPPFNTPVQITLQPGQQLTFFNPTELKFDISNGVELKRVDIRSAIMSVNFSNSVSQPLDLVYTLPNATRYGLPFSITETVPPGAHSLVKNYDLAGYTLNMTGIHGNTFNTIVQTYTVRVNETAQAVTAQAGEGVSIEVNYSKIIPQYVEGYFGQQVINIAQDTAKIGFVKNVSAHNFMLSQATMDFSIVNEFGAEFTANLSNIKSINSQQQTTVLLNTPQFGNININSATKSGTTIYPSTKAIDLTSTNSNITAFISNFPDQLTYLGHVNLNPLGNTSGYNNFAFYNTGIKILANINIPMRFTADYFQLQTNAAVNFSNVKQLDNVKTGDFVILASNGYPFDAKLQVYLLDENNQALDSLFIQNANTIVRGQLNGQNEVLSPTRSRLVIPITPKKIASLRRSKSIRVVSFFQMPPNPPEIKLYENYQFDVNVVAELNYNVGLQ